MIAVLAFGSSATGQTIDQGSWQPGPGVTLVQQVTGLEVNAGAAGANQTWDLSSIGAGTNFSRNMLPTTTSSAANTFPNATFVMAELYGDAFYELSSEGLSYWGVHDPPTTVVYQDPQKLISFPCSYNSSWTDNFQASWVSGGVNMTRTGSMTGLADGYGTLILPEATWTNVLRVKVTEVWTNSPPQSQFEATRYYFLKPGIPWWLGTFSTVWQEFFPGGPMMGSYESEWLSDISTRVSDRERLGLGLDVHPNPARDRAVITFSSGGGTLDLAVLDVTGNMVLHEQLTGQAVGIGKHELDIPHLPGGLYLVRITDAEGQQGVTRLVVE